MSKPENETVEWLENRAESCPKCSGILEYCYDETDNEWQCEVCNTRWYVPVVTAWWRIMEVKTDE